MRSKDLLTWETAQGPATPFIQSSGQSADSSPTFEETRHATVAPSSQSPRGAPLSTTLPGGFSQSPCACACSCFLQPATFVLQAA